MSKKPRFFCDNCGNEVGQNEKACRHCGRYFAAVRCPSCGFVGDEISFKKGCPSCGYSAPPGADKPSGKKPEKHHLIPTGKLPLWVYIISIGAFIAACAALIFKLK
jgi:predicted RNA-binding Zn-ribbon protein involved in translation (DUF1610 family)